MTTKWLRTTPWLNKLMSCSGCQKELEPPNCVLSNKFVVRSIVCKLPLAWRNFATSLKHHRQEISIDSLIGSFYVEEKAREKVTRAKGAEGRSTANVPQKNAHNFMGKNKISNTSNFTKKKKVRTGNNNEETDPC